MIKMDEMSKDQEQQYDDFEEEENDEESSDDGEKDFVTPGHLEMI